MLCSLTFLILIPLIAWIEKLLKDMLPLRKLRKPFGIVEVVKLRARCYSFAFVKKYWGTIQKDLYDFVNLFFASCVMPNGANSSFFTLIPKVNNPTLITDFRPISLIGIHYKIIAKILANRLSKVIDKIVSKEQSAFIAGRQILDGPVILSEIIDFGFGKEILTPFLFILVMEGLHNAFEEAMGNGLITGVNIKNSTINVSHLFYADDVIITTDWNAKDMDNIIRVLHVLLSSLGSSSR
ncbi:RNA-directed DNA polymerase, eukaryota [Tanacetum coccineum]